MARTFVTVELRDRRALTRFSTEMMDLGFQQSVRGRKQGESLKLPKGMFLIERASPVEALEIARRAAANTNVQARFFCVPANDAVRFGNLQRCA
jgi:hypothetical protein